MAERIPPGFNIPIGFYDGPEVKSIPRRIRAAAIGVFGLAGNYSATRLSDGYVDAETLKDLGCGPAIRAALMATVGHNGEPDPLWEDAPSGGIQFTKWRKWQRTRSEVAAHREAEAERKRAARAAKKAACNRSTNEVLTDHYPSTTAMQAKQNEIVINEETPPPAETEKCPPDVRRTSGQSETETETETEISTYVGHASLRNVGDLTGDERGQDRGRSAPVDPSASRLVATLIPRSIPTAVKTALRLAASQLITGDQLPTEVVAESLRRWAAKPGSGTGLLPHIAADVVREQAALAQSGGRTTSDLTAGEAKVAGWAAIGQQEPNLNAQKAIGQ